MNNALVILYEGQAPSTGFIERLGTEISNTFAFGGGDVKIIHFDQTSIAKSIMGRATDAILSTAIEPQVKITSKEDVIKHAVTFIREAFKNEIETGNNILFIMSFKEALENAKARKALNPSCISDEDEALIEATDAICEYATEIVAKRKLSKNIVTAIMTIAEHL